MALLDVVPVVHVDDLDRAIAFYVQLGFTESFRWGDPPFYAGLKLDPGAADTHLHLNQVKSDAGRAELYLSVDDVDAVHDRLRAAGVAVEAELRDQDYGMRDFSVRDPAGNFLTIGAPRSS